MLEINFALLGWKSKQYQLKIALKCYIVTLNVISYWNFCDQIYSFFFACEWVIWMVYIATKFEFPELYFIQDLLFTGTWTTVVRMCAETNNSHTTDHRVCKNGSWVHETNARRSNRPAQSRYRVNTSNMLISKRIYTNLGPVRTNT